MDLTRKDLGIGEKPAMIVVDMVKGFTDSACPLGTDCPEVVSANITLLNAFRERALPIYFTTVVYHSDDQAKVFRQRLEALNLLTPDSPWVQLDERLARKPEEELLEKLWPSAFHATDLHARLSAREVDSVVVTGLTTSGCVRATAVDGLQYDYRVVVPREAVGDRNQHAHEANLHDLHAKYADVMSVADLINRLPTIPD